MTKTLILALAATFAIAAPVLAAPNQGGWLNEGGPRGLIVAPSAHAPNGHVQPTDAYALQPRAYTPSHRGGPKGAL